MWLKLSASASLLLMVPVLGSLRVRGAEPAVTELRLPADTPPEVRKAIESLQANQAADRAAAVRRLGEMGEKAAAAAPFLAELLGDEDQFEDRAAGKKVSVADEASKALVRLGKASVKPLAETLTSADEKVGCRAVAVLSESQAPEVVSALIEALKSTHEKVRAAGLEALQKKKDPAMVAPLAALLGHPTVRGEAAKLLGTCKTPQTVDALIAALKNNACDGDDRKDDAHDHKRWLARTAAAELLGEMGDPRAVPLLVDLLKNARLFNDTEAAAKALGRLGKPARDAMMEALKAPEPETRARVGLALCLNGDKDLDIGLLIPLLTDKDGKPRPDIALAIGITQAGNPKAVETLIAALDGDDAKTKEAVASTLKTLTHQDIGPDPAKWRKWWAENKKKFMEDAAEMEKFFKE